MGTDVLKRSMSCQVFYVYFAQSKTDYNHKSGIERHYKVDFVRENANKVSVQSRNFVWRSSAVFNR